MKKYRVRVNGADYEVELEELEDSDDGFVRSTPAAQPMTPKLSELPTTLTQSEVEHAHISAHTGSAEQMASPLTGVVCKICVKPGQRVKWHEVLLEIDAMKMVTKIYAPEDGIIDKIYITEGANIQTGEPMLDFAGEEEA